MPKIKTRKTASKRFKISGKGKLLRGTVGRNHLMMKKAPSRKRRLSINQGVAPGDAKRMKDLIPGLGT